jgi:IMP dehydrogenase
MDKLESRIPLGLTFDDVLLVPQYSEINSRNDITLASRFSRNIHVNCPLVSSPMDTVTEEDMAIEMARYGGLGIVHRYNSIEDQAEMVIKVKRAESYTIKHPYTIHEKLPVGKLKDLSDKYGVNTFLVTEHFDDFLLADHTYKLKLVGIITERDIRRAESGNQIVKELMTPLTKLVLTKDSCISTDEAKKTMVSHKIEKLPVIDESGNIAGLITLKDIVDRQARPRANLDNTGRLIVGAAIGAKDDYLERAKKLIDAGVDVLVVDVANGHSKVCIDAVQMLKEQFSVDIVAGSVASGEGAEALIKAGADGIRCGIGSGSICTTRLVAGAGVPQLSAVFDCAPICKQYQIPLISDGGNRNSGNMCKALAAGADCIMLGRLVAGCDESPGKLLLKDGKRVKIYRGMAGYGANLAKAQRMSSNEPNSMKFLPEGVEGYIPYVGPLKEVLNQFTGGIRSGMSYCGAFNIPEVQEKAKFIRLTQSAIHESGVHDITKL